VQRLFTSFPDGWPGIGLVLLRCSLVAELASPILQRLFASGPAPAIVHSIDMLALLVAAALLLGFLTPLAAVTGGICILVGMAPSLSASQVFRDCEMFRVVAVSLSISLVGPGAYAVDCRLFGRREIIVPRIPASGRDSY
jgi:uncharacterized membrane protein YphA (DoxX/SURF4 family)